MDSHLLFLDEILPNHPFQYFCLVGFSVRQDVYTSEIIPSVNKLKKEIFGSTDVILHEADIQRAQKDTPYAVFKDASTRKYYWDAIKDIFTTYNVNVFSASIHEQDLKKLYPNMRDKYFICLQIILENYVHFLEKHNGLGKITIESRNPVADQQLRTHYHVLQANGTLFYEDSVLQKHLSGIEFSLKEDNIVGLQLADTLPNSLNRKLSNMKQKTFGLIDVLNDKAYDGLLEQKDRFGIKIIP